MLQVHRPNFFVVTERFLLEETVAAPLVLLERNVYWVYPHLACLATLPTVKVNQDVFHVLVNLIDLDVKLIIPYGSFCFHTAGFYCTKGATEATKCEPGTH